VRVTRDEDTIRVPAEFTADVPARIAFLGEAPSVEELEKGKPLVGPAGRIFNAMLRTAGLRREDYWIGNVFDQKLPDNDVGTVCRTKKEAEEQGWPPFPGMGNTGVLHPDWRHHLDRLGGELAAIRPNIIVPMGSTALWALTQHTDISTFRGNVSSASWIANGTKILPTFHPAHVMRLWKFFPIVVGDFI
jgi:uracil-DNA glycosylase